jgi:hypothetical protein
VRTERADAGVIRVVYDLPARRAATFSVALEASNDGGQTFAIRPRALTGDVGANVSPGTGKAIVWDSTKDIEDLQIDRYVFRVLVSRVGVGGHRTASVSGGGRRLEADPPVRRVPRRAWRRGDERAEERRAVERRDHRHHRRRGGRGRRRRGGQGGGSASTPPSTPQRRRARRPRRRR